MIRKLTEASLACVLMHAGCAGPTEETTLPTLIRNMEADDAPSIVAKLTAQPTPVVETPLPPPLFEIEDPELLQKAITQLKIMAKEGNSEASFHLGGAYSNGWGVEVEPLKAFEYFLASAKMGHARAQYCVAMMYHEGEGTPHDGRQALYWCEESAKQANSIAQFWLGAFHEFGVYVRQDEQAACRYYEAAAVQGLSEAQTQLGICCALGKGTKLDMPRARELLKIASEGGIDLPTLRNDLWQQAVEIDEYPVVRIAEHQEKFAELKRDIEPTTESYQGPNGTWVFRDDSVLSRQEREFDQLMAELIQSKPERDRQIARLLNVIELIDEIIGTKS